MILSFVEWSGAFQRPQHMAVGFARRGWRVVHISPGYVHRRRGRLASGVDLPPGLRVVEPPALPGGGRLALVSRLNRASMLRAARAEAARLGGAGGVDVVLFNDPRWAEVAAGVPARMRVFDAMDDLSAHAPHPAGAAAAERRALGVADRVFTGTAMMADRLEAERLKNELEPISKVLSDPGADRRSAPQQSPDCGADLRSAPDLGPRKTFSGSANADIDAAYPSRPIRFIPCGVDAELFASPDTAAVEIARREVDAIFAARGAAPGPLAGYFGALNERVDPELVAATLRAGWRVLLIGPKSAGLEPLPDAPELAIVGPRPYAGLPAYLALMDAALIPYRTEGPNRFLYPVKALEYLAGGKPVISSPLPDMRRFLADFTILPESPEAWRAALADPATMDEARRRAAAGQLHARARGWDAMVAEMEDEMAMGLAGELAVAPSR